MVLLHSRSEKNDIDSGKSELFGCGLKEKFPSITRGMVKSLLYNTL